MAQSTDALAGLMRKHHPNCQVIRMYPASLRKITDNPALARQHGFVVDDEGVHYAEFHCLPAHEVAS